MTIQQIYKLAIDLGKHSDLRNKKDVERVLKLAQKEYQKLPQQEKQYFDKEKFTNPYSDSKILIDKPGKKIKKILTGIDIDTAEVLLADRLGDIDLIISHHPTGKALADGLEDVMHLQADVLSKYGIPINIAEKILEKRISEVSRSVNPVNHYQAVQAAKLFDFGWMTAHTVCDNMVAKFLEQHIKKQKPETLEEALEYLLKIPEYKQAKKMGFGPRLFAGKPENRCGKIAITEITGGTEGSKEIYEKMAQAGIGTTIAMHQSEEHKKAAEKAHINVIIAGHISSDSIGMNLFLDELEKKGIKIIPCSGLIRVKRKK